jgi:hypothetical protein
MPECILSLLGLLVNLKELVILWVTEEDMNMEEYFCFAHLSKSMLLNNNAYEGRAAIFSVWQLHALVYIIRFALRLSSWCI